jgi:hypothetical protein
MRLDWHGEVDVPFSPHDVYGFLSDFRRHHEWAPTLERLEVVKPGDAAGVGTVYLTTERIEMEGQPHGRHATTHTYCEVRELVPDRVIAWHAHPRPHVGNAELRFELEPLPNGWTRLRQRVREHYPEPVGTALRFAYGLSPEAIERQLNACLRRLEAALYRQGWRVVTDGQAASAPSQRGAAQITTRV